MSSLKDRIFIVSGASRGIGRAVTDALLARGARVAALARNVSALEASTSPDILPLAVDITDRANVQGAIDTVLARWKRIDGLVNNAGAALPSPLAEVSPEQARLQFDVNVFGTLYLCQAVIPAMRRQGGGRIVNIGSATVRHMGEFAHMGIYGGTKAAVERMTFELREEVKADNIGVTLFSPGAALTGFNEGWDPGAMGAAFQAWLDLGKNSDGAMDPAPVGEAIARCFELPEGMAYDFVELRPNRPTPKALF
ncbi:MAG: SDR family NAD(P)-dependent oxidoreductase [Proteobacteria bacterium]|nr:SDR family NAD(P)-dependent oxidoreductase [Pseudomonadota bacterium]HQR02724.1 SDR family NAD(P)-dependent oxidoreductase [Rhodocyclaceae bacterium]